ncbi:MAG TPA: glutamate formimidoyltransferase, partial [Candidatus Wujingus californicus]
MTKTVECVPNFSEGRDAQKIAKIVGEIEKVKGVKLLNVESDADYNRTVVTFAGSPEAVKEAAFYAIEIAAEVIDMSKHKGEHPRI